MSTLRLICLSGFILLTPAPAAFAENTPQSRASPGSPPAADSSQILYKGVVGNLLEAVPMDPAQRVTLQRSSAVISNTLSGRSLSVLAKLANPALLIGGIAWGLWAASNINSPATAVESAPAEATSATEDKADTTPAENTLLTVDSRFATLDFKPAPMSVHAPADSVARMPPQPRVIRVWLFQPAN